MKKTLSLFLAILIALGLSMGALAEAVTPKSGGTLIIGLKGDPQSFNPDSGSDDYALPINSNVFNALVSMTMDMDIVPDLAQSWDFSEDGKSITFHLAENVKWHDGTPFTSADVKWTYDTIKAEKGVASNNLASIKEVLTPDDNTVVINLEYPDSGIMGFLAWYGIFIMPKHIYEGTDWLTNPANMNPIGTGPFKFENFTSGVAVTLVKNEDYWGEGPYLDKLIFQIIPDDQTEYQAWQNGEIDIMGSFIPGVDHDKYINNPEYTTRFNLYANRTYFTFNFKEGPFADVRMRKAFNLALDRDEIYEKGIKGNGAKAEYYISPLFTWALNEDAKIPAQNIEEARKLVEECGYTADANGIYITAEIDVFSGFEDALVVAQANLKEAGIDLKINTLEYSAWVEKVKKDHNFHVTMLAGYQGPDIGGIRHRIHSSGGNNMGFYNSPRIDELLHEGVLSGDLDVRAPIYKEIQAIISEDLPMVFTNENGTLFTVRNNIKNLPAGDTEARNLVRSGNYSLTWIDD
jgi:peptide/nickel transport system substrate-binding protein